MSFTKEQEDKLRKIKEYHDNGSDLYLSKSEVDFLFIIIDSLQTCPIISCTHPVNLVKEFAALKKENERLREALKAIVKAPYGLAIGDLERAKQALKSEGRE